MSSRVSGKVTPSREVPRGKGSGKGHLPHPCGMERRMFCTDALYAAWEEPWPEETFPIDHGLWLTMGSGVREVEGGHGQRRTYWGMNPF